MPPVHGSSPRWVQRGISEAAEGKFMLPAAGSSASASATTAPLRPTPPPSNAQVYGTSRAIAHRADAYPSLGSGVARRDLARLLTDVPPRVYLRYRVDTAALSPALRAAWVPLELDAETLGFLREPPHGVAVSWARSVLRAVMSDTDALGVLAAYRMHVVTAAHAERLLGPPRGSASLLDLGAGEGSVTAKLAPLFETVVTTEMSRAMAFRLWQRGFESWRTVSVADAAAGRKFDVVSCLNLLDRCSKPRSVLDDCRAVLAPDGRVLLAIVLPYSPFVQKVAGTETPEEQLPLVRGLSFEQAVNSLVAKFIEPAGFTVQSLSRVPYLCRGDCYVSMYELDDAVLVLKSKEDEP